MSEPRARKPAPRDKARPPDKVTRARQLRVDATPPERRVWARLRAGRVQGLKFRRQHPIGPYVADFYCHEALLVVEIDGAAHQGRGERDRRRDAYLAEQGVYTLRISGSRVKRDIGQVIASIAHVAKMRIEDLANEQ